jgi:hypothetical protein
MAKKKSRITLPNGQSLTPKQFERLSRKRAAYKAAKWLKENKATNIKVNLHKARYGKLTKKQEDKILEDFKYKKANPGTELVKVRRKPREADSTYNRRLSKIKEAFGQEESKYKGLLVHANTEGALKFDNRKGVVKTDDETYFEDIEGNGYFGEEVFVPLAFKEAVLENHQNGLALEMERIQALYPDAKIIRPFWTQYAGSKMDVQRDGFESIGELIAMELDDGDSYQCDTYFSGFVVLTA